MGNEITWLKYNDRPEYLKIRQQYMMSTDVSCLFHANPYTTYFELWHIKKGTLEEDFDETERMEFGKNMEEVIAKMALEKLGLEGSPLKDVAVIPHLRVGASFDWNATDGGATAALIECKNVDKFIFKDRWSKMEGGEYKPPDHIALQCRHQLFVANLQTLYLVAFVGGNELKITTIHRDEKLQREIIKRTAEFWESIDQDSPPSTVPKDPDAIIRMNQEVSIGTVHPEPNKFYELATQYREASERIKELEGIRKGAKADMLEILGDHQMVKHPEFSISAGIVEAKDISFRRKQFRNFQVRWKR